MAKLKLDETDHKILDVLIEILEFPLQIFQKS